MAYQSLYRKYRPQTFNDVVGQDNIIQTLSNAIKNQQVGHAYIFSGPRGTGKTSIAKIFAKEVSCTCTDNTCQTCEIFKTNKEVSDVWEIDAASNNGVDEIRRIIDNVNYMPMELKYKVYIIDEVHMLSKAAFNALLKTLEEPPSHVIFILATTEIHKIPLTVLSRCQRFDFKRISEPEIIRRLSDVLSTESIPFTEEGLNRIAKLADGGMRDALSLVEKVLVYGNEVTIENVNNALQLVGSSQMETLLMHISNHEINNTIELWHEILAMGIDENKFIIDMQYYLRDILLEVVNQKNTMYTRDSILYYLKEFNKLENQLNFTNNFALVIEVYLIEMASQDFNQRVVESVQTVAKPVQAKRQDQAKILEEQRRAILNQQPNVVRAEPTKPTPVKEEVNKVNENTIIKDDLVTNLFNDQIVNEPIEPMMDPGLVNDNRDTDMIDFLTGGGLDEDTFSEPISTGADFRVDDVQVTEVKPSPVAKQNEESYAPDNVIILDVLEKATAKDKQAIISKYPQMQSELEASGNIGISKFFTLSTIQAASEIGYVITIDPKMLASYTKRIGELEKIFYNYTNKKGKIFLLELSQWQKDRPYYIEKVKEMKEKDIFATAKGIFGEDIVNKI